MLQCVHGKKAQHCYDTWFPQMDIQSLYIPGGFAPENMNLKDHLEIGRIQSTLNSFTEDT